jgi:hypothetical protein
MGIAVVAMILLVVIAVIVIPILVGVFGRAAGRTQTAPRARATRPNAATPAHAPALAGTSSKFLDPSTEEPVTSAI